MKRIAYVIGDNVLAALCVLLTLVVGALVAGATGHTAFAWIDGGLAAALFILTVVSHEMTISRDGGVEPSW